MVGIVLALVAGLLLSRRGRTAFAVVVPLLLVCGFQTWGLAAGLGVNPSETVSDPTYYGVQAIILVLSLLVADQIRVFRLGHSRRIGGNLPVDSRSQVLRVVAINILVAAVAVTLDELATIAVARQSGEGLPPVYGIAGIALMPVVALVFGALNGVAWRVRVMRTRAGRPVDGGVEPVK
jgi:hypothetical protein